MQGRVIWSVIFAESKINNGAWKKNLSSDWLQMCTLVKGSPWGYAVMVNSEVKWILKVMVIFKNFNKEKNAVYTFPTTCREWKN